MPRSRRHRARRRRAWSGSPPGEGRPWLLSSPFRCRSGGYYNRAMTDNPETRPVVTLLAGHHRRAAHGHPWVYSNEVAMDQAAKALEPGTLVTLKSASGETLGVAMFNPRPLVSARL